MSARGKMTMRAVVERDTASGTDAYGHSAVPDFTALATLPCFVWSKQRREVIDGIKTAVIEDLRAMFQLTADIRTGDKITSVTNRRGVEIMAGNFLIEPPQRKHDHLEALLERVT